jgi:antitoxin component YwqK of YwqJK toxin-antitoxin module
MGCSQSLKEFNDYYSNGVLRLHCYKKNNMLCGPTRLYYENGNSREVSNYINNMLFGQYMSFHKNGELYIDKYSYGYYDLYAKWYNEQGLLILHSICGNDRINLCATYQNNKLESFVVSGGTMSMLGSRTLYDISPHRDVKIVCDLRIINPIRVLQQKFKKHIYRTILNELNNIIHVIDLSEMIVRYIKN